MLRRGVALLKRLGPSLGWTASVGGCGGGLPKGGRTRLGGSSCAPDQRTVYERLGGSDRGFGNTQSKAHVQGAVDLGGGETK